MKRKLEIKLQIDSSGVFGTLNGIYISDSQDNRLKYVQFAEFLHYEILKFMLEPLDGEEKNINP